LGVSALGLMPQAALIPQNGSKIFTYVKNDDIGTAIVDVNKAK